MNRSVRWLRRAFGGTRAGAGRPPGSAFARQSRQFTTAQTLIRCFYVFLLYLAIYQFTELGGMLAHRSFAPLWPVTWMRWAPSVNATKALLIFYVGASAAGAWMPGSRLARCAAWAGLLEFVALKNSSGKIGHSMHLLVLVSGVLVFLPAAWGAAAETAQRRVRQSTLLVFWACQAVILLAYTMSGVGKFGGALYQIAAGQPNAFLPGGLGAHVAQRLLQTHSESVLGGWIIGHPWLTWPLMPFSIYLELFSFWVAFRPALHRFWAGMLILFHAGTFFTMTITFPQNCLLLALFFFPSPFQPEKVTMRGIWTSIPVVGALMKVLTSAGRKGIEGPVGKGSFRTGVSNG